MNLFNSIIAALLAVLIASPLCCCAAKAADVSARPSCCGTDVDGKEGSEKEPHVCACSSKQPRDEVKNFELLHHIAVLLEPVVQNLAYLSPPVPLSVPMAATPHTGCDPPRLLLARYSRWLI